MRQTISDDDRRHRLAKGQSPKPVVGAFKFSLRILALAVGCVLLMAPNKACLTRLMNNEGNVSVVTVGDSES